MVYEDLLPSSSDISLVSLGVPLLVKGQCKEAVMSVEHTRLSP